MKAILFSIGTRGDIEPFLSIAELLRDKNWEVFCVFPEQFRETVEEMGIPFQGFTRDFLDMMNSEEAKKFMGGHGSFIQRIQYFIKMARMGIKHSKEMTLLQHQIQINKNPDKIFYHPKCNIALIWSITHPGKSIMVSPIPFMTHPIDHLSPLGGHYGKYMNRLSTWLINTIKAVVIKRVSMPYIKDYGINNIAISEIKKAMLNTEKTLYTISPSLFPRPDYWPPVAKVVGYYERDKTTHWQPSLPLLKFIEEHSKIVFITFGSMINANPIKTTSILMDVLNKHNIAAIINTSWGGIVKPDTHTDNIFFVANIPYDWAFSKMYAVVHHGGSGTTHTALKYGCPSLIVSHVLDQPFWSKTISDLKLGPEGIPVKKLAKDIFEYKLKDLLTNEVYKKNAEMISKKIKSESNKEYLYGEIIS